MYERSKSVLVVEGELKPRKCIPDSSQPTVLDGLMKLPILPVNSTSLLSKASSTFLYRRKSSETAVLDTADRMGSADLTTRPPSSCGLLSFSAKVACETDVGDVSVISPGPDVLSADKDSAAKAMTSFSAELGDMNEFEYGSSMPATRESVLFYYHLI